MNLNEVEPGTNDRDSLSSVIVVQSYVRILIFVHHLVCDGRFRISNVPPYSAVSLDYIPIMRLLQTLLGCAFHTLCVNASAKYFDVNSNFFVKSINKNN